MDKKEKLKNKLKNDIKTYEYIFNNILDYLQNHKNKKLETELEQIRILLNNRRSILYLLNKNIKININNLI